jgi:hypothetical protein
MEISAVSGNATAAATLQPSPAAAKASDGADAQPASTPASDTVTLSPAAQQAVADGSAASPSLADTLATKAAASTDKGLAQFYGLAASVLDNSGQYTQDQQLDAYLQFKVIACNAGWQTSLADFRSVYNAVTQDSPIAQKAASVAGTYNAAAMKATQSDASNNSQGIAQAQLDAANAMPDFDRKVLFEAGISNPYRSDTNQSQTPAYADQNQWLSALQDQASGTAPADTATPFAQNANSFYSLAAVINDTTGKYAQDDQLTAYETFMKGAVFTQYAGMDGATERLYNQTIIGSAIGQMAQDTYSKVANAGAAAFVFGDPDNGPRIAKAQLAAFHSLSPFEQKVYFTTQVNEVLQNRGHPYSNMQQWVEQMQQWAGQTAAAANGTAPDGSAVADGSGAKDASAKAADDPVAAYAKQVAANGIDADTYLAEMKQLFGIGQAPSSAGKAGNTNQPFTDRASGDSGNLSPPRTVLPAQDGTAATFDLTA